MSTRPPAKGHLCSQSAPDSTSRRCVRNRLRILNMPLLLVYETCPRYAFCFASIDCWA